MVGGGIVDTGWMIDPCPEGGEIIIEGAAVYGEVLKQERVQPITSKKY